MVEFIPDGERPLAGTKGNVLIWLAADGDYLILDGPAWVFEMEFRLKTPEEMPESGMFVAEVAFDYSLDKRGNIKNPLLFVHRYRPVPVPTGRLLERIRFDTDLVA